MAGRDVTVDLNLNDQQAVTAWQRNARLVDDYTARTEKIGKVNRKNSAQSNKFFASHAKQIATMAVGFIGVGAAIRGIVDVAGLVRAEFDNMVSRQTKAGAFQLSLADAERQLLMNIGKAPELADNKKEKGRLASQMAGAIAFDTQTPRLDITNAMASAFSARGDATVFQAADAVDAAARVTPSAADLPFLASGALDLGKAGANPKQALGFMAEAGSVMRLEQTAAVAKNLSRVVGVLAGEGEGERESAALFGYLTQAGVDAKGEPAVTGTLGLSAQLREHVPEGADSFERLSTIAGDETLRKSFVDGLRGEEIFKPIFKKLVTDPEALKSLIEIRDRLPTFEQSGRVFVELEDAMNALPSAEIRQVTRIGASTAEALQGDDPQGRMAAVRGVVDSVMNAAGVGSIEQRSYRNALELGSEGGTTGGLGTAALNLVGAVGGERIDSVERGAGVLRFAAKNRERHLSADGEFTDAERSVVELLRNAADKLQAVADANQELKVEVKINNRKADADVRVGPKPRPATALSQ